MELNSARVEQIQTVFVHDDDFVEFTAEDFSKGSWYVSNARIHRFGEEDPKEGASIERTFSKSGDDRPYKEFYEEIKGKNLKARIFLGRIGDNIQYQVFKDWEKLAKALGISELVTLATKVPKVVARRFTVFANQEGDRSSVLRGLVYNYVKQKMIDEADTLMFKEDI